jgi:hypothetical protein
MIKAAKFFRKQADRAERMARAISDEETSQNLSNLALAYRSQADALKQSKLKNSKPNKNGLKKGKLKKDKKKPGKKLKPKGKKK